MHAVGGLAVFLNKISGITNVGFKGYQHVKNNVGETVYRFNYPFDYEKETCELEIVKVKQDRNYNLEVIEEPIARIEIKPEGVNVNLQSITNLYK